MPGPPQQDHTPGGAGPATAGRDLVRIAAPLIENLDLDQRYTRLAQVAAEALAPAQCVVFAYDPGDHALIAVAMSGPQAQSLSGLRLDLGDAGPASELRRRPHFHPSELLTSAADPAPLTAMLAGGCSVAVPLVHRHELLGVLVAVEAGRTGPYGDDGLQVLIDIAALGSLALLNARMYRNAMRGQGRLEAVLARMSQMREHERKTFAAMVHDDILQSMVGALYAMEGLRDTVAEAALEDFDHVVRMLRISVDDARKLIWELRPAVLDGLGLAEALGVIADRIAVDGDIAVTTTLKEPPGLGEALSTAIYKIGREALLNAERHAHARHIDVALGVQHGPDGPHVVCTVTDDGCGYDVGGDRVTGHYGLVMMEEQAAAVGGALTVTSHRGQGTSVSFKAPLLGSGG